MLRLFFYNFFFGFLSLVPFHQVTLSSLPEQQVLALQHRALSLLTDIQPSFADTLINIYHLSSLDLATLRAHIVRLQALACYKEVNTLLVFHQKSN